jgi:hypothetical protein
MNVNHYTTTIVTKSYWEVKIEKYLKLGGSFGPYFWTWVVVVVVVAAAAAASMKKKVPKYKLSFYQC